jgi:hypothetical protein
MGLEQNEDAADQRDDRRNEKDVDRHNANSVSA